MLITDESLGVLFVKLGLITEDQKSVVLREKIEKCSELNFYQIALTRGYIRKGSVDEALNKFKTDPGCSENN